MCGLLVKAACPACLALAVAFVCGPRTDARGMIFAHTYDELSRRTQTIIDDAAWFIDPPPQAAEWRPPDRISRIEYGYLPDGKLEEVTAHTLVETSEVVLGQNSFEYDEFDNLKREHQSHDGVVQTGTPNVEYTWVFSSAMDENFNRLVAIQYPAPQPSGAARLIGFEYGNGVSIDDELNRITKISASSLGDLATYAYMGTSRRVSSTIGPQLNQTFVSGSGYNRLDRHGRITDLNYTLDSGSIVHRYKYGYDLAGNRTYAWARQAIGPDGTTTHINDRSYLYTYDDLHRLIDAKLGKLNSTNDGIDPNGPTPRETRNWSGGDPSNGSVVITEGANTEVIHHAVNANNQITQIHGDIGEPIVSVAHDPAGNMVFDGVHYFQYDAFNRLVQVSLIGTAALDPDGKIESGELGQLVARYMYDGLGRLARKSTPVKAGYDDEDDLQRKDYYYDGVRRIQEVITRPGDQPAIYLNDELPDTVDPNPPASYTTTWTDREYVWGPDYVDELVCQIDRTGAAMYAIQDANYNLMALTDASGAMLEQYTYDPYGTMRIAETYTPTHPVNRVGHQGLFFDRFDGTANDGSLALNAQGMYYNRNRSYSPVLARFLQRDPNATATLLLSSSISTPSFTPFSAAAHYADGLNLYQYLVSNPHNNNDMLGLSLFEDAEAVANDLAFDQIGVAVTLFDGRTRMQAGLRLAIAYMHAAFMWDDEVWELGEQALIALLTGGFFARACFVEETPITLSDGSLLAIEEVAPGDVVLTYDPEGRYASCATVERCFVRHATELVQIQLPQSVVRVTPDHPFFVDGCGWIPARDLQVGDNLVSTSGTSEPVRAARAVAANEPVYNIEVADLHTYFVGQDRVLVHNECAPLEWTPTRANHVRAHNYNNLKKPIHGVFTEDAVLVTEQAWRRAAQMGLGPNAGGELVVPMGKTVGWQGGYNGTGQGLSSVRLVLYPGTTGVRTAYPF